MIGANRSRRRVGTSWMIVAESRGRFWRVKPSKTAILRLSVHTESVVVSTPSMRLGLMNSWAYIIAYQLPFDQLQREVVHLGMGKACPPPKGMCTQTNFQKYLKENS